MPSDNSTNRQGARAKRWPQVKAFLSTLRPLLWPTFGFVLLISPLLIPLVVPEWTTERTAVKFSGLLFQLAGIGLVVLGLSRARETFGERGLWRGLRFVWRQVVRIIRPPRSHSVSVQGHVGAGSFSTAGGKVDVQTGNTIEDRVAALEKKLKQVRGDINAIREELSKGRQQLNNKVDKETKERRDEAREIRRVMNEAVIGGIHLEATGVVYIAIGIILTTFPGGIATFMY